MKLLNSVLITTILSVSTIGTNGKMRSLKKAKKRVCNDDSVGELFTCLSGDGSHITEFSAIENSKCYPGHGMNADTLRSLFKCVDKNGDGKISATEATELLCVCLL